MPIKVLPPELASQIAAGEVVERPSSVVKELVENALDAGTRLLSVEARTAGRELIRVADDGAGIPADELVVAVERHATSKLTTAQDLFRIATLGFRGEALASIGSVSRLTITSCTPGTASGARLQVEGGKLGKLEKVGAPVGTTVQVEDLFYNVPARLKFLKKDVTERRLIDSLVTRYALAYPHIRFHLKLDETTVLQTSGDGDRRAILAALYGVEVARQMLEVVAEEQGMRLSGYLSPVAQTRSNRREITFFINGRWVQDTPLTSALLQAYHTLLMVGRYPMAILFVEIPPDEVDVNVHPAKAEVRFRDPDRVFGFILRSARKAILAYTPVPPVAAQHLWGQNERRTTGIDPTWMLAGKGAVSAGENAADFSENPSPPLTADPNLPVPGMGVPLLRLIGQVGASYLVAEGPDGLYLIDQHAAHERVLFEKLMAQHERKAIPAQELLTPVVVELPGTASGLLQENLPILQHLGFLIEPFGQNTFRVRGLPVIFAQADPADAVRAVVEDFEEDETPLQSEREARLAGRVCKRLAVKAGQVLSVEEQRGLLNDLEACASPRTCPHGRPTMIHLSVSLLERQFGRKGAR